jgi:hypothetical protein
MRLISMKPKRPLIALSLAALTALLCLPPRASAEKRNPVLVESKRIWDKAPYNSFTDLIRFQNQWFCCFREGIAHTADIGKIRVLRSPDGVAWTSAALIGEAEIDLRDPKFSLKPDGQLMIIAGGLTYDMSSKPAPVRTKQPRVMFSTDGLTWTPPTKVLEEGQWLWRVDWHEGKAYGISYPYRRAEHPDPKVEEAAETNGPVPPGPYPWKVKLLTSTDGLKWETVTHLDVPGRPNEATVRIRPDGEMIALVRRERGNYCGWIGCSKPPYREWTWHETGHRFGGPNFIVLPDNSLVASGRSFRQPYSTVIASMDRKHYDIALTLPSGGSDTGYPGMVWHNDELWLSYYSNHEDKDGNPTRSPQQETQTAIYLARIRFQK